MKFWQKTFLKAFFLSNIFQSFAFSMEVDNFLANKYKIRDSLIVLDSKMNEAIDSVIEDFNSENQKCEITLDKPPSIYYELKGVLAKNPVAELEEFADSNPLVDGVLIKREESIYQGSTIIDAPIMVLVDLARTINVNGVYIGTDKLGHALAQGYSLFEKVMWEGKSIEDVLKFSFSLEDGFYGTYTTGVLSYGDLASNFYGMLLWRDLLYTKNAIIQCEKGKYIRKYNFTWANYVNDSWNEAINCSTFSSLLKVIVEDNFKKFNLICPLRKFKIQKIVCSNYFLNPILQIKQDNCPIDLFSIKHKIKLEKNKLRGPASLKYKKPNILYRGFLYCYDGLVTFLQEIFGKLRSAF